MKENYILRSRCAYVVASDTPQEYVLYSLWDESLGTDDPTVADERAAALVPQFALNHKGERYPCKDARLMLWTEEEVKTY